MNSEIRREALTVLNELTQLAPQVRLGQLFAHLGFLGEDQVERTLWDIEDDELLMVLNRHRTELLESQHSLNNTALDPTCQNLGDASDFNIQPV